MYTSDIERNRKRASVTSLVYLLTSLICVLFGAVYEIYSHEVYSYYMLYAFVFPLAGGTLPFSILSLTKVNWYPNALPRSLYHSGIATLTVGSFIRGVLDIYGTTNALSDYYWPVGICFVIFGILIYVIDTILGQQGARGGQV